MKLKNKITISYWIIAWFFSILFGEIIGPLIARNPLPILQFPIAFIIYYGILSFAFSYLFYQLKSDYRVYLVIFIYGVIAELFLFKNINGFSDILGILFFGLFYVFLFGLPYLISAKIWRK